MKKDRRTTVKIILIILLAVLVVGLFIFVLTQILGSGTSGNDEPETTLAPEGNQSTPETTNDLDSVRVTLKTYETYQLEDLDFDFVIARIGVEASEPINIELSHFRTSEGTDLSNVDGFVKRLEEKSYYLGRQNVWFSLISKKESYDAVIFIPVLKKGAESISVKCDFGTENDMEFDLTKNINKDGKKLYYQSDDVITDGKTYQLAVSEAFEATGEMFYVMNADGSESEYRIPQTDSVYVLRVDAVSLWGDSIVLEAAEYIQDGTTSAIQALDSKYSSMKESNILGRAITDKDSGYIFFQVYGSEINPIKYDGVLRLKLQGSDTWITVNVDLN